MANRFERIDNTAPVIDVSENTKPEVKYSNFDLGRKIIGQAIPYAIIPIDVIETLPNSEFWLNYDVQITFRNPTMRKMLNGWRVYLHSYYNRKSDLWEGWNNFITCGRSGYGTNGSPNKIPHIQTRLKGNAGGTVIKSPFTPMSLYNYLGYPSEYIPCITKEGENVPILTKSTGNYPARTDNGLSTGLADYTNIEINALKPVMYQRLWRDKFSPQNLLQNNKKLFPDNEDHFILSYNASTVGRIDYENEEITTAIDTNWQSVVGINDDGTENEIRIDCLRFRQFQGDRFTTASPFDEMLRGVAPNINLSIDGNAIASTLNATTTGTVNPVINSLFVGDNEGIQQMKELTIKRYQGGSTVAENNNGSLVIPEIDWSATDYTKAIAFGSMTPNNITATTTINGTTTEIQSTITLSQLRSLEVFTIFAERMARTNGNYNEMIKAQFGHNPKALNREAIYIGGSFQDIIQNSIYQTSETTENSQLGRQVAQGVSASYNKIGYFKADDYGYIMTVMSIVPETIYTTGISKLDTALTMEEQYFPIMNNLSAEPILNKELYVSGIEATDNDLWGYAERFSEYKSRRNKALGFSELPSTIDEYDSALVMARRFSTTPNLNAAFVTGTPNNYSLDSFASNEEPPFDFAIRQDVNANYPMPYVTIPQGLGTRA